MSYTVQKLVENIEGCVFGYTQSDEISLLLRNNQTLNTNAWFDNNLSKILSVSASMATLYFNERFRELTRGLGEEFEWHPSVCERLWGKLTDRNFVAYDTSRTKGAIFDARAFVLPEEEVVNYFIWRQEDCSKNSIQMLAQSIYPHKELQGLHTGELKDKMMAEGKANWDEVDTRFKLGITVYKRPTEVSTPNGRVVRNKVYEDLDTPVFVENRDFVEKWLK